MADNTVNRKARQEIELTGEQEYRAALKSIANDMSRVKSQQALVNSEYAKGDQSAAKLIRQKDLLSQKLDIQKNKLKLIAAEIERVSKKEGENSEKVKKLQTAYEYAQRDVNNTEAAMKDMGKALEHASGKMAQFTAMMKESNAQMPSFVAKAEKLGGTLTKAFTAPIAALGAAGGKMYMDYEKGLYTVSTIADTTQLSLKDLGDQLLKASDATGMAATDMTTAAYDALSAGVDTANAASFVEIAAKAAKGGLTDVTTAVDGATSAINAWGIGYENAESVFDKFIIAQNLGKTTLGQMAQQIGQLTGIAPQVGVSLDSVLAATAALTKNGVQTSTAMNGLKAVMSAVIKPTAEAAQQARKLKLEFSAEALREKGFTGFLQDVIDKTGGSEEALAKLFGSVEGLSQVMLLAGTGADDYAEALDAMSNSAGATQKAFEAITSSKAERLSLSLNRIQNTGIRVGETLTPAMEMVADATEGAAEWMSKLSDEQIQQIVLWGAALAAVGPFVTGLGKVKKVSHELKTAWTAASTLFNISSGKMLALVGVIGGVATAIGLLSKYVASLDNNGLQAAFDSITIDTSALQQAVSSATASMEDLTVYASGKIEFEATDDNIQDSLAQYFGKKNMNWEQFKGFKETVNDWVQPWMDAAKASADEDTQALAGDLQVAANQYKMYALQLAQLSTEPTNAQLLKLEELHDKVIAIGNDIMLATNQNAVAAEAAWVRVQHGEGSTADVALANVYAQATRTAQIQAHDAEYAKRQEAADLAIIAADKAGDESAFRTAVAEKDALLEQQQKDMQAINEEHAARVNEIIASLAEKYPEQIEAIRQIHALQEAITGASALQTEYLTTDVKESDADWQLRAQDIAKRLTGEEYANVGYFMLNQLADQAQSDMAALLQGTDISKIMTDFYASVQSGLFTGFDPALLTGDLAALITAVDLKDDAKTIGQQWAEGEIEGVNGKQEDVNTAIIQHCESIIDAAMNALGVHSPSTKAMEIMDYWTQGEVIKLKEGRERLQAALREHLSAFSGNEADMYNAGARAMAAYISGMRSQLGEYQRVLGGASAQSEQAAEPSTGSSSQPNINNQVNINYTGSVAMRDAQRLAQTLGQMITVT